MSLFNYFSICETYCTLSGGEFENVAILVAIAVNEAGYREVLGAAESMKADKASWGSFFQWLRGRGLDGVKLLVGDKCLGMLGLWVRCFLRPNTSGVPSISTAMFSLSRLAPR